MERNSRKGVNIMIESFIDWIVVTFAIGAVIGVLTLLNLLFGAFGVVAGGLALVIVIREAKGRKNTAESDYKGKHFRKE